MSFRWIGSRRNSPRSRWTVSNHPLIGIGLTDRIDLQGIHFNSRIEHFQFAITSVYHVHDTIDGNEDRSVQRERESDQGKSRAGQRGFDDVRGDDTFAPSIIGLSKDLRLQITEPLRIDEQNTQRLCSFQLGQTF